MNEILLIGLNHQTAPVEVRECIAFSSEETTDALDRLKEYPSVSEAVLFSTCNRVEVLITTNNRENAENSVKSFISEFKNSPQTEFEPSLYVHHGDAAVRHVFRVVSSLDSMMVGEPQILGQIKEAYHTATQKKTSGTVLNRLLHRAFFVAKRVRTETGIGDHAVSISYAAIELAKKIFGTLERKKALLIGAGEMAELAVEHLIRNRVDGIYVANRTFERGVELARQFNGQAIRFEEIMENLEEVDIIISSTGSNEFVIRHQQVKSVLKSRKHRPLFFIDIAVPRDVEPKINRLGNAYVYDIDDLKSVVDENIEDRQREAVKGERIVDEAVIQFRQWYGSLEVVPTIVSLREKLNEIADTEVKKTLQSLTHLNDKDRSAIMRMAQAMVNKMVHDPTVFLKGEGMHGNKSTYLDITRKLFKLN